MMSRIGKYFSLVKFAHTIFAMPFAAIAFVFAIRSGRLDEAWSSPGWWIPLAVQVVLCMIFARNVAMGFNRWADRKIDAENPRTADREIPAGRISPNAVLWFVGLNASAFLLTASTINWLTALLSPVALAVVMAYSYCKRFTALSHLVLGLSLGIAPAGACIAVSGTLTWPVCLLSLLVMTWCGGFDIIYALQDADFDRAHGLHSVPARFSARVSLFISIALHAVSVAALFAFAAYCPGSPLLWIGCGVFTALLVAEHLLVTPAKQRHIGIAFGTLNGAASLTLAVFVIADLLLY